MRGCWRTSGLCPRMRLPVGEGVEPLIWQAGGWELARTEVVWFASALASTSVC